jgi:hypothetical protein
VPERAASEAQTAGSRADSGTAADFTMLMIDVMLQDLVQCFNQKIVDTLLVYNFGDKAKGTVRIKRAGVAPAMQAFYRGLVQATLGQPANIQLLLKLVDVNALVSAAGLPAPLEVPSQKDLEATAEAAKPVPPVPGGEGPEKPEADVKEASMVATIAEVYRQAHDEMALSFNPDQPREANGKFGSEDGGGKTQSTTIEGKIKAERVKDANEVARHLQAQGLHTKVQTAGTGSVYLLIKDKPFDESGGADVQHTIRYADHPGAPTNEAYPRDERLSPEEQAKHTIKDIADKKEAQQKANVDYEKDAAIRDRRLTEIEARQKELAPNDPGKPQYPADWKGGNATAQAKVVNEWREKLPTEKRAAFDELQKLKEEQRKLKDFQWRKIIGKYKGA